ncbi:conserved hypothetical protein [Xylanimonas cellulosilytica DSM 15894]|uniref:PLD phosphodiesterase domain-containing protein n=1 Tax=Xylanimonas cellulosilytica (strain DSM 15894 / JCM 12276 / CECT 5975 / KCTC 9989 / LMG 20990 / NBRC 107835 / XIL07) TaxID=446471 RepID=D1BVN2_XYLCX|nr:phospholipase D family protein [Xylanimonas cellulosilytica]ACZ31351.1 conserved hypothetical protein [Xylanimonas cellulosilytica DSM 15894]
MLEPQSRATLTDILHPPAGFSLVYALATTFTLDVDTALTIPLSFAARRVTSDDDPIGILDAVRRAADRIDIFAQTGQVGISVPPSALVAFLEPMIHPVEVAKGIFHPKVWILEYERGDERVHRFVCASRNLTADRSWDVVVALDGVPADADGLAKARQANEPLARLVRALPELVVTQLSPARRRRVESLASRILDVEWTLPPEMRGLQFHVWGLGERPDPQFWGIRGLFVSPFLTDAGLIELKKGAYQEAYLVSRGPSIDGLAASTIDSKLKSYVLDDAAELDQPDDSGRTRPRLAGLHAKTYVFDRQDGAHVFVGSLNATWPALHENVEVMVETVGTVSKFGVRATLAGLEGFLEEYPYPGGVEPTDDEVADRDLSAALRRIAGVRLHANVVSSDYYELHFWRDDDVEVPPDVELSWQPITWRRLAFPGLPGMPDAPTVVGDLGLTDITPFVIVTARDARGEGHAQRTVVVAELHDDPADRRDAVIAAHLTDRAAFIRFLMLLLDLRGISMPQTGTGGGAWGSVTGGNGTGAGLFEALMRSVGPNRTGLEDVQRVVEFLSRQPDGDALLPEGFAALWESVWAAQQAIQRGRND